MLASRPSSASWPTALRVANSIEVEYRAGYGTDPASIPADIRQAVLMLTANLYEHRGETVTGSMPDTTARKGAFDLLGKAYEGAGSLQANIRTEFETYLRAKPSDAPAYAHYGAIVYSAGGRTAEARQALARALNIDPNLAEAHLQLGIIEQAAGDWNAALARFQRAAKLQPENAAVRYRLANVYQKLGESEKARVERAEFQRLKSQEKSSARP